MYQILRLCQPRSVLQAKRFLRARVAKGCRNKINNDSPTVEKHNPRNNINNENPPVETHNPPVEKDFNQLLLENKEKITFSSFLEHDKLRIGHFKYYLKTIKEAKQHEAKDFENKSLPPLPVVLRYCVESNRLLDETADQETVRQTPTVFQLPFANTTRVDEDNQQSQHSTTDCAHNTTTDTQLETTQESLTKDTPDRIQIEPESQQSDAIKDLQQNDSTRDLQQNEATKDSEQDYTIKDTQQSGTVRASEQNNAVRDSQQIQIIKDSQQNETIRDTQQNDATAQNEEIKDFQHNNTNESIKESQDESITDSQQTNSQAKKEAEFDRTDIKKWMANYEYFDDTKLTEDDDDLDSQWSKQYGTPDPTAGISNVPCYGCGALLHCSDPAIPGYLPSEIYKGRTDRELCVMECQRCHFLKEYNIALDVTVQPQEYERLLQAIRHVKSLVVLMVDLLDFPCSIWPGIVDIIGTDRPIIIVGNKVDLIPGDSRGYLKRIELSLLNELSGTRLAEANIKHVALVSAKTGYGVEELVSAMFKHWLCKGDVFLVGCTNVGKSSLFNALLQSDYCKVHAADLVKRATVSRWPGTTLNLLKFPINRPSGWKIYQRTRRLKAEAKLIKLEKEIRKEQLQGRAPTEAPALIGHIGRTFSDHRNYEDHFQDTDKTKPFTLQEKEPVFAQSKWFYDTPGVIHPDQVLSLLSTEELLLAVPKQLIKPQTYYLQPGYSLFLGGLARMDHVECSEAARFTVFCSDALPITVTKTEDADEVYNKFVGTELFAAPRGGPERLRHWPGLECGDKLLQFSGQGPNACCGDVVLSSVGWIGVSAKKGSVCAVKAWTPNARGIYRRTLSVLPHAVTLKGKRLRDTPAYAIGRVYSDEQ